MSKNFELMQQAGLEQPFTTVKMPETLLPKRDNNEDGYAKRHHVARRSEASVKLDEFALEEAVKMVQRIFLAQGELSPRVVLFAGVDHGTGCSEICMTAAKILATNTRGSVCVVEGNLRSPSLPGLFGTTNHYGLTDALMADGPIRTFAKPMSSDNLWLLSSGSLSAGSAGLLNSERLKIRLAELRAEFDYVLIDAPPLTRYADAIAFGKLTDGFVLVVEANSTRREAAVRVSENLRAANVSVLGAVLSKRTFPIPDSVYYRL